MSSISVARWVKLLAAVSPSSECLYEGKADVVYLQVTLCDRHLSAEWSSYTDDRRYTSPLPFLSFTLNRGYSPSPILLGGCKQIPKGSNDMTC